MKVLFRFTITVFFSQSVLSQPLITADGSPITEEEMSIVPMVPVLGMCEYLLFICRINYSNLNRWLLTVLSIGIRCAGYMSALPPLKS